jgi:hypothetical protein
VEERSTGDRGRKARLESIAEVFPTCRRGNHVPERIEALGADLSYAKREGHIIALLIAIRGAGGGIERLDLTIYGYIWYSMDI